MSKHFSEQGVSMYLIGDASLEERQHAEECAACQAKIASLAAPLSHFRGAVRTWSDRASAKDRAAELRWTVIPASDHLERLLLPASLDVPWYRSLWSGVRESSFSPQRAAAGHHLQTGAGQEHLGPVRAAEKVVGHVGGAAIGRRGFGVYRGSPQTVQQQDQSSRSRCLRRTSSAYQPKRRPPEGQARGRRRWRRPVAAAGL